MAIPIFEVQFGKRDDDFQPQFGSIGRNGGQYTGNLAQELILLPARSPYQWTQDRLIFNFNGGNTITSHGDLARPETARLMAMRILS